MSDRKPVDHGVFQDIEDANRYDKESHYWNWSALRNFTSAAQRWGITSGKVLDVGSGSGTLAIAFAGRFPGVAVTGLDLSDITLKMAGDNVKNSDVSSRVSFEKGDAEDMPFEDGTFNLVISSSTLHLLNSPIRMFDEIQRVLKPDGRFFINDYRRSLLGAFSPQIKACYSPEEAKAMLNQSRLQNWRIKGGFFWLNIFSGE
jgi:ubiquinone/menaquinone biosynthesis C-methylase UbiE